MMQKPFIYLLFGLFLPLQAAAAVEKCSNDRCNELRTCTTRQAYTVHQTYYKRCWKFTKWFSCSKSRSVTLYRSVCCPDYGGIGCHALCNPIHYSFWFESSPSKKSGCNQYYHNDYMTYRNFTEQRSSGGNCKAPNCCENCNSGFYADCNGKCTICPPIQNCEHRTCEAYYGSNNKCEYCKYENAHQRYERAYKYNDVTKICEQTCSWRPDSTRCFPGNCSDEYRESCICTEGFESPAEHCTRITIPIIITAAHVQFVDKDHSTVSSPEDVNKPTSVPKKWTNLSNLTTLEFNVTSVYKVNATIPKFGNYSGTVHFVTNFSYGIIGGTMRALFKRGNEETQLFMNKRECNDLCNRDKPCPVELNYRCESGKVSVKKLQPFRHNDWLNVTVALENGGFLVYENRDDRKSFNVTGKWTISNKVYLKGLQTTESYIFHWDTEPPYYNCLKLSMYCLSPQPVFVPDILKIGVVTIYWNIWSDDLSGIDYYNIEVFKMHPVGNGSEDNEIVELPETVVIQTGIRNLSSIINVTETGMYAVHFIAFDIAGNYKTARAFFLYDTNELIDLSNGQIKVLKSVQYLDKGWITYSNPFIEVEWKDKFVKTEHFKNSWLAKIKMNAHVEKIYDDNSGRRNVTLVPNVKGIVKFEIGHEVYDTSLKSSSPLTHVPSVYSQTATQNVIWEDGNQVVVKIRAFDVLDNYRDENVTAYKDSTPPIISNVWLTKGDRVNIAVHSVKEFNEMMIEWDAFDYHSGISHLKWRLYDNFTGTDFIHGEIDLPGQGETKTLAECQGKFNDSTRGPTCYCTKYTGCYHKHFYVKPHIAVDAGNGINHNRSNGVHDSEYYIDVNVTNMATLTTLKTIKITVDVTPPVAGHVHDGIYGSPEVDYQQDLRLNVHWEGFFDHESGVAFYHYDFARDCLPGEHFQNKSLTDDTYNTFASYNASNPGTYFVTVVAYNRAYAMSKPVCSDGVTITKIVPSVKNVIVTHARTKPRLVRDGDGNEWYIDKNLQRHILENNTDSCKFSDQLTEDIEVFPVYHTPMNAHNVCKKTRSYSTLVTRVIPKIHMLNITWTPVVDASLIDDYEVGVSSVLGSSAPDMIEFQSSRRHTHILFNHFGVSEGKLFYIIIKSISKSNVMGFQTVGPFIQDTTSPQFVGTDIGLSLSGNYLVANWSVVSFEDSDNTFALDYEYAIGHTPYSTDIQQYSIIKETGPCIHPSEYMCTATNILDLDWKLHGHHEYYVTVKATNLAGQYITKSSVAYIHDILLPTRGLVIDVPGNSSAFTPVKDIEDIDYTTITDHLAVRWKKFYHPHLNLTYYACVGTFEGLCVVAEKRKINSNINMYLFSGLSLTPFKVCIEI